MKKLPFPSRDPKKFRKISFEEFSAAKDFDRECRFDEVPNTFHCPWYPIWHHKNFNTLLQKFKPKLTIKKILFWFLFYINTCFLVLHWFKDKPVDAVGLFLILCELEKFYEEYLKLILPSESNKTFAKRFYLDIKRRIFNIFYFFSVGPETLKYYLNNFALFIITKRDLEFKITEEELNLVLETLEKRKKSLILEYNEQYLYIGSRKEMPVCSPYITDRPGILEVSDDYLDKIRRKNKFKFPYIYYMNKHASEVPVKKIIEMKQEKLKEALEMKQEKLKEALEIKQPVKKSRKRPEYNDSNVFHKYSKYF